MRRAVWMIGLLPLLAVWGCAGCDVGYVSRVLIRQDSGTEDFHWKRTETVQASPRPSVIAEALDPARVEAAFEAEPDISDLQTYLHDGRTGALLVYRGGALIYEWYPEGVTPGTPVAAFSQSKTVFSLILARAVARGSIAGLDTPITDYVPELAKRDARFSEITMRELLDMRSGIAFEQATHFPWVNQDSPRVYYATNLQETILDYPRIASAPGPFVYNDYAPNLNGLALQRATGEALTGEPFQSLWNDLGAEFPALWTVDHEGFAWHESGLVVAPRDALRFGRLMLESGQVDGQTVAPAAFLSDSLESDDLGPAEAYQGEDLHYRNAWWALPRTSGPDDILALGAHGQVMLVSPANDTVIVRMGRDGSSETNFSIAVRLRRVADRLPKG